MFKEDFTRTPDGMFAYGYPRAAVTTDSVIFGFDGHKLNILLVKRGGEPFLDWWAFPGGFLNMEETVEECAARELREETGYVNANMEQFGVFSAVERDPRWRVVTVGYYALVAIRPVQGGDDAKQAQWFPIDEVPHLAFDHDQIYQAALQRLKQDICFRPIGFDLLPEYFTIPQLQRLYESILGKTFERRNFMKKMIATGILDKTDEKEESHRHRAATYYTFNREKYNKYKEEKNFRMEF